VLIELDGMSEEEKKTPLECSKFENNYQKDPGNYSVNSGLVYNSIPVA